MPVRIIGGGNDLKRYPDSTRCRRQEGVTYLRFTMDRRGEVLAARIERTSGFAVLEEEALALIRRSAPLPPLPREVAGDPVEPVVPVRSFLE